MVQARIRETIHKQIPLLKSRYRVKRIGIFGSFARGEQKRGSDLDVLVEFTSPIGFFDFIRLENLLSRVLRKKVDLVSKRAIKSAVQKEILKEVQYV